MQSYGKVSIIIPSWNCGRFLEETIKSIQDQTYTDWELLFQDDCSTDNTKELVTSLAVGDPRIKYECNNQNSGEAVIRNSTIRRATGKWTAFLIEKCNGKYTLLYKKFSFSKRQ